MRVTVELSLALCCGFLGMCVSAWNADGRDGEQKALKISGFLTAARWEEASELAQSRGVPVVVYVGMAGATFASLHESLGSDPVLQEALSRFVPVAAFLDGPPEDRTLAARLGAAAAPDFFVVTNPSRELAQPEAAVTRLRTVTGSTFERFGLTSELWAHAEGRASAASLSEPEPGQAGSSDVNGVAVRHVQLEAAVKAFRRPIPGDAETPLEQHLALESHEGLRFLGWSLLASWLERCANGAKAAGGEYLGVPSPRWETRLRDTTRRAWISCPDDRLLPFGGLLIQRYARVPRDLDSLDRAFMGAVVRTLSESPGADEFPGAQWLVEARAALPVK